MSYTDQWVPSRVADLADVSLAGASDGDPVVVDAASGGLRRAVAGSLTSAGDVHITADSGAIGTGDVYLTTGTTTRARIRNNGNFEIYSTVDISDYQTGTRLIPAGTAIFTVTPRGNVMFGVNPGLPADPTGDPSAFIGDYWSAETTKLWVRSIIIGEKGDNVDVGIQRANGVFPDGDPMPMLAGEPLGAIWWRGWPSDDTKFGPQSAQLYVRAAENISTLSSGGEMWFATTPIGSNQVVDRMAIRNDGQVEIWGQLNLDATVTTIHMKGAAPRILVDAATNTGNAFIALLQSGDVQGRYLLRMDGKQEWGPGANTSPDTNLYRSAAATLKTDASFAIGSTAGKTALAVTSTGTNTGLTIGGDATLYRQSSAFLKTDGQLEVGAKLTLDTTLRFSGASPQILMDGTSSSGNGVVDIRVTGDTQSRFLLRASGQIQWGPGGAAGQDTNLYRSTTAVLKTDNSFHVATDFRHLGANLGFYNHATATQQTVTGSRGGNAALASLLAALAATGLIVDTSTA